MSEYFVHLDTQTLEVSYVYTPETGLPWCPDDIKTSIPVDVLSNVAVQDETTGLVSLQADPTKISGRTESLWSALRAQRNQLLTASDWTQGNDSPLSTESKSAWAAYRAALRTLPDVTTDPLNPMWPTPPQ